VKDYSKRYDIIDDQIRNAHRLEYLSQRKAEMDAFMSIVNDLEKWKTNHSQYAAWEEASKALEASFKYETREETIEEELEVKETLC